MTLIKPTITTLPFSEYDYDNFQMPDFYYNKVQCRNDCFFGTITDRKHLPPFIVKADSSLGINTKLTLSTICSDDSDRSNLTPKVLFDVEKIVPLGGLGSLTPSIGDLYYELTTDYIVIWDGSEFANYSPYNDGELILDKETDFIVIRKGDNVIKTNQGFQVCTIGDFTYFIYSGFEFNEMINCGFRHVDFTLGENTNKFGVLFDGSNDFIGTTANVDDIENGDFTFEAFIKGDESTAGSNPVIFSNTSNNSNGVEFFLRNIAMGSSVKMLAVSLEGDEYSVTNNGTYNGSLLDNKCHHVAVSRSGSLLSFYIDGKLIGTRNISGDPSINSGNNIRIGYSLSNQFAFEGIISDLRIWELERTQEEISNYKNIYLEGNETGLLFNWQMNEGDGRIVFEKVSGDDGQFGGSGTPTVNDPIWILSNCGPVRANIFISELIDVKDFDYNSNEYYKMIIGNTNNLGNIPYSDLYFKQWYYFRGRGIIGQPESTITEEKEEDGLGNEKITFQKRRKVQQLDTEWIPEYIIDFLEFAQMHDSKEMKWPLELNSICIENYEAVNDWLDKACYGSVNLKFSTEEDLIKSNCGQILDKSECIQSIFDIQEFEDKNNQDDIEALPPSVGQSWLIIDDGSPVEGNDWENHIGSIATWTLTGWSYTAPVQDMMINNLGASPGLYIYSTSDGWNLIGSIEIDSFTSSSINLKAFILSSVLGWVYYKLIGDTSWTLIGSYSSDSLSSGISITDLSPCETYQIRVLSLSNNCDYGFGPIEEQTLPSDGSC